jgi:hypothetical protein
MNQTDDHLLKYSVIDETAELDLDCLNDDEENDDEDSDTDDTIDDNKFLFKNTKRRKQDTARSFKLTSTPVISTSSATPIMSSQCNCIDMSVGQANINALRPPPLQQLKASNKPSTNEDQQNQRNSFLKSFFNQTPDIKTGNSKRPLSNALVNGAKSENGSVSNVFMSMFRVFFSSKFQKLWVVQIGVKFVAQHLVEYLQTGRLKAGLFRSY